MPLPIVQFGLSLGNYFSARGRSEDESSVDHRQRKSIALVFVGHVENQAIIFSGFEFQGDLGVVFNINTRKSHKSRPTQRNDIRYLLRKMYRVIYGKSFLLMSIYYLARTTSFDSKGFNILTQIDRCARNLHVIDTTIEIDVGNFGKFVVAGVASKVHMICYC